MPSNFINDAEKFFHLGKVGRHTAIRFHTLETIVLTPLIGAEQPFLRTPEVVGLLVFC
jgi:hypothetical protein